MSPWLHILALYALATLSWLAGVRWGRASEREYWCEAMDEVIADILAMDEPVRPSPAKETNFETLDELASKLTEEGGRVDV